MEMRFITLLFLLLVATWLLTVLKSLEIKDKLIELEDELREVAEYSANGIQRVEKRIESVKGCSCKKGKDK